MTIADLVNSGLSIIPITPGAKYPCVEWKVYQERKPTPEEYGAWNPPIGIVCGRASGGVVCIDFDDRGSRFLEWINIITAHDENLALKRLVVQSTPSGGFHVIYRCPDSGIGNVKLARLAVANSEGKIDLIETRGEGGQFLCAPSLKYDVIQGSLLNLSTLTLDEHELLISCAKSFNEFVEQKEPPATSTAGYEVSPFDDYDATNTPIALLENHGWEVVRTIGDAVQLRRPGKVDKGISATWNHVPGRLYVFTTNTNFENNHIYKPSAVYAILEHRGNFKAAAAAMIDMGFGKRDTTMQPKQVEDAFDDDIKTMAQLGVDWRIMVAKKTATVFGFKTLDRIARQFSPGEVMTIAARSGVGKTTLGLALLRNVSNNESRCAMFFSLEMSGEMIYQRGGLMYIGSQGYSFANADRSEFSNHAVDLLKTNASVRTNLEASFDKLLVVDKSKISLPMIAQYIAKARSRYGAIDMVGIDYLGYLQDNTAGSNYEKVSRIAKGCKELAKETKVRVVLLCQTSREGEDGTVPVELHHLRDSGAVEESADYIIGMWGSASDERLIHCKMLKNRWQMKGTLFDLCNNNLNLTETEEVIIEKSSRGKVKDF